MKTDSSIDISASERAKYIAARNTHMWELRMQIKDLRMRVMFWKWLAIGMTLACIACAVLAR